jgi:hypothetical protein
VDSREPTDVRLATMEWQVLGTVDRSAEIEIVFDAVVDAS